MNKTNKLDERVRKALIGSGNEVWDEDGETYMKSPDGTVMQFVSSCDVIGTAYEAMKKQMEEATVVTTVIAKGFAEVADTPELKAYAEELGANPIPYVPVAEIKFKTADEILTWVADRVDAGEDVLSADTPQYRQIGFSVQGIYASIELTSLRNGFDISPDVAARFGQPAEFIKQAFGNPAGRTWIAHGGRQPKVSEPELDPNILEEYQAILQAEAEEVKPVDHGNIDEYVPRPG